MYRMSNISVTCIGIGMAIFCTAISAAQPRISLDTPRGGETYIVGQEQNVRIVSRLKSAEIYLSRELYCSPDDWPARPGAHA